MTAYELLFQPFMDYGFMRRALAACVAIAISGAPLGVFLMLRRMTLVGDAMSHAILPGVSLAFLAFGLSLEAMTLGGLVAGLMVALAAGAISHYTPLKEDASFTGVYLISLAVGVMIISLHGNSVDLMHVLFGNVLAVDRGSLLLINAITSLSAIAFAALYRSLILECFDPEFMQAVNGRSALTHYSFLTLLVLNLVAAFQALGTMMALGLMILPALTARFWCRRIDGIVIAAILFALGAGYVGLLLSYHANLPSGPAIVLTAGACYILSIFLGRHGSVMSRLLHRKHYAH